MADNENPVGAAHVNLRVDKLESNISDLRKDVGDLKRGQDEGTAAAARMDASIMTQGGVLGDIASKLDEMGGSVNSQEATKGMLDGKTVIAVCGGLIALLSVGYTMLHNTKREFTEAISLTDRFSVLRHEAQEKDLTEAHSDAMDRQAIWHKFLSDGWFPHVEEQASEAATLRAEMEETRREIVKMWDHHDDDTLNIATLKTEMGLLRGAMHAPVGGHIDQVTRIALLEARVESMHDFMNKQFWHDRQVESRTKGSE